MHSIEREPASNSSRLRMFLAVSFISCVLLLLMMTTIPGTYDEGITLSGAMRVMNGQVPHRDFYAIYGPAHFYVFAWLFKIFGSSLLLERIFYAIIQSLIVASVFWVTATYCGKMVTALSTLTILLWFGGAGGAAIITVSFLNLIGSALLIPIFTRGVSKKRTFLIGTLAGLSTLFRYDAGFAMLGTQVCIVFFAMYLHTDGFAKWLRGCVSNLWPYIAGFAFATVPPAVYYLSVAKLQDFIHDIVIYPGKYYSRARSLPFPGIHLKTIDYMAVYLPIIIALISMYIGVTGSWKIVKRNQFVEKTHSEKLAWHGLLIAFGLLSFVMYFKGLVRISPGQMYLSILPSIILIGVLYTQKASFGRRMSFAITCLFILSIGFSALATTRYVRSLNKQHAWVLADLSDQRKGKITPALAEWCDDPNPLTKGFCFLPSTDRIDAIEFIERHTAPDQTLYVGTFRHDKIIVNDNIIYFAAQRMPATHWSHFDPLLQNRADIQTKMIQDLEAHKPPYVILDSEFDDAIEPNESAKSSGVMLMDNYIRSHYRWLQATGVLSIWQRLPEN